jgi:hypothetical protein
MLLLAVVLGAEAVPMVAFIRLRVRLAKGQPASLERKARLIRMHWIELKRAVQHATAQLVSAKPLRNGPVAMHYRRAR